MLIRAALAALGLLLSAGLAFGQNPVVAKKHQALYNQLQGQLVQFASQISAGINAAQRAARRRVDRGGLRAGTHAAR